MNGDYQYGILLVTRLYAFVTLGGTYTCKTAIQDLAGSLEQNFHVPSKFAYGVIGAFNLIDTIKQEIADIKLAAKMRNIHLSYLSPTLYFKSILAAMNWSTLLAQGMNSHLFVEDNKRTHFKKITIKLTDYLILFTVIIAVQIILIF
ncbi:energy-coupling factor transporter transmembrane protein EcfT [Apilactobacillus kunkeei]|nr:energy-coupling factor transporter transmembrane protein EcfT [Apilactobacillus kunkeei]